MIDTTEEDAPAQEVLRYGTADNNLDVSMLTYYRDEDMIEIEIENGIGIGIATETKITVAEIVP